MTSEQTTKIVWLNVYIKTGTPFHRFVNKLLWDEDADEDNEADGRRLNNFRRRGLMQRPMPQLLRRDNNFVGQSYRGMVDTCYGIACSLGLQSLADSIARMFF